MNREAYLDALGITVWRRRGLTPAAVSGANLSEPVATDPGGEQPPEVLTESPQASKSPDRSAPAEALGMLLGPGQGSCLFLCGSEDDTASALASDLARVLPVAPVWAQTAINGGGMTLQSAVEDRLFTAVVIFGQAQALLALGGAAPEQCGVARVAVVPELKRLATDREARKSCWQAFRSLGLGGEQ